MSSSDMGSVQLTHFRLLQWLNYSEVRSGTKLHWLKLQCYTKSIVTKTKYVRGYFTVNALYKKNKIN